MTVETVTCPSEKKDLWSPVEPEFLGQLPDKFEDIINYVLEREPLQKIFMSVLALQVANMTEISDATFIQRSNLYQYCSILERLGLLKKIEISATNINPILQRHIQRYWSRGLRGYDTFRRMRLYTIATPDQYGRWTLDDLIRLREAIESKTNKTITEYKESLSHISDTE